MFVLRKVYFDLVLDAMVCSLPHEDTFGREQLIKADYERLQNYMPKAKFEPEDKEPKNNAITRLKILEREIL